MVAQRRRRGVAYVSSFTAHDRDADRQTRDIARWARSKGVRLTWHHDACARDAGIMLRQGLRAALAEVALYERPLVIAGYEVFADDALVASVFLLVKRVRSSLVSATGDELPGRAQRIAQVLDDYERSLATTRLAAVRHRRAREGKRVGAIPWGYRLGGDGETLVPQKTEQRILKVVQHMRHVKGWTLQEIARRLRDMGVVGRTGKPLGVTRVFELLDAKQGKKARNTTATKPAGPAASTRP